MEGWQQQERGKEWEDMIWTYRMGKEWKIQSWRGSKQRNGKAVCTWDFFLLKIIFVWFRKKVMPEDQNHQTICLAKIVLWKKYQILAIRFWPEHSLHQGNGVRRHLVFHSSFLCKINQLYFGGTTKVYRKKIFPVPPTGRSVITIWVCVCSLSLLWIFKWNSHWMAVTCCFVSWLMLTSEISPAAMRA